MLGLLDVVRDPCFEPPPCTRQLMKMASCYRWPFETILSLREGDRIPSPVPRTNLQKDSMLLTVESQYRGLPPREDSSWSWLLLIWDGMCSSIANNQSFVSFGSQSFFDISFRVSPLTADFLENSVSLFCTILGAGITILEDWKLWSFDHRHRCGSRKKRQPQNWIIIIWMIWMIGCRLTVTDRPIESNESEIGITN